MSELAVTAVLLLTVLAPMALRDRFRRGAHQAHRHPTSAARAPGAAGRRRRAVLGLLVLVLALIGPAVVRMLG